MAQPPTPSTFPVDPTVPSLQDIRERLDRSERMFATEELEAPAHEEEWEEMKRKRRSDAAGRRGKRKRTTLFSENKALVKGIYVVARGYRCAYLVDTIVIDKNRAEVLGRYFASMTAYKDTSFLFEETTEQVYIVNLPLVRARSEQFRSLDTAPAEEIETLWLQVDGGKPLLPAHMPRSLRLQIDRQIAQEWMIPLEGTYEFCPEDTFQGQIRMTIDPKDLPALSAWMLEYPVGYTFSADAIQKTNLDGEPLVLVKVKILGEKELGDSYDLLAFSYPAVLLEDTEVQEAEPSAAGPGSKLSKETNRRFLQDLPTMLHERYENRLNVVGEVARPRIEVTAERVRLEKVVL